MDGWLNGWMDGWMNRLIDKMGGLLNGEMDLVDEWDDTLQRD